MITVLGGNSTPYLDADLFFNEKESFEHAYTSKKVIKLSTYEPKAYILMIVKKTVINSQC